MVGMFRRFSSRLAVSLVVAGLLLAVAGLHAQEKSRWTRKVETPPPSARIEVTILKADNGKPIENAAVIFHPIEGERDKGSLELKSNEDGKAVIDVLPVGDTVRLQVIANGFQTYGHDYKIDKATMTVEVRMKRPVPQYSIYKDHKTASNSGEEKNANPPKDDAAPAQGDKSSGSASQSDGKPDASSGKSQNQDQQSENQNPDQAQTK